jgi:hypothetical protein
MGRKKRNGMKPPPQSFKKFPPKEKVKRMASRDDLARIEQDFNALREEAKAAVAKFNEYSRAVSEQIKEILDEVGVYEEVSAIEKSRDEVRKTLDGKLKGLQEKANELAKIRAYLNADAPVAAPAPAPVAPAPAPAPVEEAPAPVEPTPVEEVPAAPPLEKKAKGKKAEKAAVPAPVEPAPAPVEPAPAPVPVKKERKAVEPPKF